MKIISIINYKGGVGKTTITANIASELVFRGKNVLAIDLDPQANLTFSFIPVDLWEKKYQNENTIKNLFDSFVDREELLNLKDIIIHPTKINKLVNGRLDLICSHLGLINVDLELAVMLGGASPRQQRNNFLKVFSLLKNSIKSLEEEYDVILIDCPPNFNIVTKNALVASDYYIVPAKMDYLSTLGIDQLNRHIKDLVSDYNNHVSQGEDDSYNSMDPKLLGIVCTMVGITGNSLISAQQQYYSQIKRTNLPIFETKVRENKTIYADAPEYGVPVVVQNVTGSTYVTVRQELEDLTQEFIRKVGL